MNSAQVIADKYRERYQANYNEPLEKELDSLMRESQGLYWKVQGYKEKEQIGKESLNSLSFAKKYIELMEEEFNETSAGLKKLESVKPRSHIHSMGGDQEMGNEYNKIVVSNLSKNSFVNEVYYFVSREEHIFLITLADDNPDITLEIFELYWELQDSISHFDFEFKPVPLDQFNSDLLPSDAQLVFGR
ncbi:hypothetical protein [Paenibacillus macquariensis]|uniref:Uncharacterized protein n=1 Tax=Paenibacillus macquariensis TaxID=948756 RepID=A0ABY1JWZ1_9BACL|nr:hypothetical protein [Paenibacillus macquariensis]MEC0089396.1 hypothetical protein [Paenibacillus macquariensis]OAB33216.1 hypothetical protein PMSM_14455 [Paenibacillus macquariensis subsp. macquariensis]SIQ92186.1 hypothetical protein SAMN05421578_10562 [Paenibacillus macquariensis]